MSQRREIARKRMALDDIAGIMSAMRGLALMETNILRGFLQTQRRMVNHIELTLAGFLSWYAPSPGADAQASEVCIVLGSEQGFCGDFNESLLEFLLSKDVPNGESAHWLVIGQRLANRCEGEARVVLQLPGASVADEVPAVLMRLTRELNTLLLTEGFAGSRLSVLYHGDAMGEIRHRRLLPVQDLPPPPERVFAPDLNLRPPAFLASLTEHYLYAALNEVLYSSLMAENRLRHVHMEQALKKLDEDRTRLSLAYNAQRQEDITEEIEVILLSAQSMEAETGASF